MFHVCAGNNYRNNILKVGKLNVVMEKMKFIFAV